jgi:RHS repeat-associated protein
MICLRSFAAASIAACTRAAVAESLALQGCEQIVHPVSLAHIKSGDIGAAQDVGNITVMEFSGDYARNLDAPRQQIAAKFFATHPDQYDFLVVFTTFEFDTGNSTAFYSGIRNDTAGIGLPDFDVSSSYGSEGRLQGYIDMAALTRYAFAPTSPTYHDTIDTLAHELMHRWGVHVRFIDATGNDSTDLLGRDGAHWSYFVDSGASLLYGADWALRPDGSFASVDVRHRFSPLDLYLAGFASEEEVAPFALIRDGSGGAPGDLPQLGATSIGHAEIVDMDQIIEALGPRSPSSVAAQKDFTAAMILVKRSGETVPVERFLNLERFRVRFEQQMAAMTDGRASIRVFTQARSSEVAPPAILQGTGTTPTPGGIAGAIAWLESRQAVDGHWEDRPATATRDTAAVLRAFEELKASSSAIPRARAWIAAQTTANLDQQSWKLVGTHSDDDAHILADARDSSGGYAIEPGWNASNLDTSLVATALADHAQDSAALGSALQMLGTNQNADGSFGVTAPGRGRLLPTLRTSVLLAGQPDADSAARLQRAAGWIAQRQSADGGMRSTQLSSLAETIETYSVMERLHLSAPFSSDSIRSYVTQAQQIGGDWSGSVYLTANAILAVGHNERPNLALAGAPRVLPAQPNDGERVTLKATVTNTGNASVASTQLQWYDGNPELSGIPIGAPVAVRNLAAGERVETTQTWDTTAHAGDHVLWVVVDAAASVEEASEQDNRAQTAVTVLPPSSLPNLLVIGSEFALTPPTVTTLPISVQVSGQIHNIGAQDASAAKIRVYAKPDFAHALAEVVTDIAARSSAPVVMNFVATEPTSVDLVVRADPDNAIPESNETDNELALPLPFGDSLDLDVTSADLAVVSNPALVGRPVQFALALRNLGTTDAPPATLHVDVEQGGVAETIYDAPLQIAAGQTVQRQLEWTPGQPGAAQLRVALDPADQIPEGNESNNNAQLNFAVSALEQADLTFASGGLQFEPNPALEGQPLMATLGVRNLSSVATGEFRVALYAQDPQLGSAPLAATTIASLPGSDTTTVSIHVAGLGLIGDQRLFAKIDADDQIAEIDETNNVVVGPLRSVPLPDASISVADIAQSPITFDYQSDGLRIAKHQGNAETRYQYDQQSLLAETNAIGNTLTRYHYSDTQLLSRTEAGSTPVQRHYLLDALGSPIALLTQQGAVSSRTRYDAWGQIVSQQDQNGLVTHPNTDGAYAELPSADQQPIGFTGYIKDVESGLYYAKARYYDPRIARFTTQDPEEGKPMQPPSLHRYLYAYANPTVYTDLSGRCIWDGCLVEGAVLAGVIGWAGSVIHEEWVDQKTFGEAASNPRNIGNGLAVTGTVVSGGTLGIVATTGLVTTGVMIDMASQVAVQGKSLNEVDYAQSVRVGGIGAGVGGVLGPALGAANPLIAGAARTVTGGAAVIGAYQGGTDIGAGFATGNDAQALLGVGEAGLGLAGGAWLRGPLAGSSRPVQQPSAVGAPPAIGIATAPISGETSATAVGKAYHSQRAAARRESNEFTLVNQPILDSSGRAVLVERRVDLSTGEPISTSGMQISRPDAVSYPRRLIVDDKPLDRPISKDQQEIGRFIRAYKESTGELPQTIGIERYDPRTGQPIVTELYTPYDFPIKSD